MVQEVVGLIPYYFFILTLYIVRILIYNKYILIT